MAAAALGVGMLAGCGGGGSGGPAPSTSARPRPGSVAAILARPGANVTAIPGDASFVPGQIRLSFLVLGRDGSPVERPTARVWVAAGDDAVPFATTTARLEQIGVPGESGPASLGETRIYVARFSVPKVGIYTVVVEPVGRRRPVQAALHIQVTASTAAPEVGAKAIASRTPTIATVHGDLARLTTRVPPDRSLLRYSVADSIAAHVPFVLVFATPKFCTSRTCGPVVDVVEAVSRRFRQTPIRFIHVEVYRDNDPGKGFNTWFKQWHLTSEPWTFLVGGDGRIEERFEGSVSVGELASAVSRLLARPAGTGR